MKQLIKLILFAFLFSGCSAQKYLQLALKKNPHLFDTITTKIDTIVLPRPEIKYVDRYNPGDTITINQTDTITHELTKIQFRYFHDSIFIKVQCPPIKIIEHKVIAYYPKPWTGHDKWRYRKQGAVGIIILLVLIFIGYKTRKLWTPYITGGWSSIVGSIMKIFKSG